MTVVRLKFEMDRLHVVFKLGVRFEGRFARIEDAHEWSRFKLLVRALVVFKVDFLVKQFPAAR